MKKKSIAVFDTGVGGLTVLKQITKELPNENLIYFGDTKRVPYGPRPKEQIIEFTREIVDFLLTKEIKAFVIACNTITSVALEDICHRVDSKIPVIGVIESGVKMAIDKTNNKQILVLGTEGTINSRVYDDKIMEKLGDAKISGLACPELVEIAEKSINEVDEETRRMIVKDKLDQVEDFKADTVILGCTHFPILESYIREAVGEDKVLVDPSIETVVELKNQLSQRDLLNDSLEKGKMEFYVSSNKELFTEIGERILEFKPENVYIKEL